MPWEAKEYGYHMTLHKKKKILKLLRGKMGPLSGWDVFFCYYALHPKLIFIGGQRPQQES